MSNRRSSCALAAALVAALASSVIAQPPPPIPGRLRTWKQGAINPPYPNAGAGLFDSGG